MIHSRIRPAPKMPSMCQTRMEFLVWVFFEPRCQMNPGNDN